MLENEKLVRHLSMDDAVNTLVAEQRQVDRFPCRFVFVSSFTHYKKLVECLRTKAGNCIRLSDDRFCRGQDTVPSFSKVVDAVRAGEKQAFLLEGFGEYLRLVENNRRLALDIISLLNLECHSEKRVWIPVLLAKNILFNIVGVLNHRYEHALYEIDTNENVLPFNLNVYPDSMANVIANNAMHGVKAWLQCWEDLTIASGDVLVTRNAMLFTPVEGAYSVRVIKSPFAYIHESVHDAGSLVETMGTKEQWGWLACKITAGTKTLEKLLKEVLNVSHFVPVDVLSRWDDKGADADKIHWLIWLWYHKGARAGSDYFSYAIGKADNPEDIPLQIEIAILDDAFKNNIDDAREVRNRVLRKIGGDKRSKNFWNLFEKITDDYLKLKLLTCDTKDERVAAIRLVGKMLNRGERLQDVLYIIERTYPLLAFYLTQNDAIEGEFIEYFKEYKLQKIKNVFDSKIDGMYTKASLLAVQSRNECLKNVRGEDDYTLIIDGMGVEWTDFLIGAVIRQCKDIIIQQQTAAALLPTETAANHFWDDWDKSLWKKDDRLDAKSHIKDKSDGVDLYALTELQFEIIQKIAEDIVDAVKELRKVIVTADHGLSRLAAIHYNQCTATSLPMAAVANGKQSCRYCQVDSGSHFKNEIYYRDKDLLIISSHDHFKVGGWIPGETHGGMTPEEYLVPVLVFSLSNVKQKKPVSSSYKLLEAGVRLNGDNEAKFVIEADAIKSLRASCNNEVVNGVNIGGNLWSITFKTLRIGQKYQLSVFPNNIAVGKKHDVEIKRRGMEVEDDF